MNVFGVLGEVNMGLFEGSPWGIASDSSDPCASLCHKSRVPRIPVAIWP